MAAPYVGFGDFPFRVASAGFGRIEKFEKFGRNPAAGTGVEDVWNGGGVYTGHPTGAAETLEIASSDTDDTAAGGGGTGARTVQIHELLDANGAAVADVTVSLNGQSQVSLGAGLYTRSARMTVLTAGSGGKNAGTLTLRHTTTTANIFAVMPIGYNKTLISAYTVPTGKVLFIDQLTASMVRSTGTAVSGSMSFRARAPGCVFESIVAPEISQANSYEYRGPYHEFAAGTDLKWSVESTSTTSIVYAEFSGYLADTP